MVDRAAAACALADFLRALGHDPSQDPELASTPARVTAAFADELLAGYAVDIGDLIRSGTCARTGRVADDPVTVQGIHVTTICPHHLLPAHGAATVTYLPGDAFLGIGVIARLVDALARRLTLQEAVARNVVDALMDSAGARGAYCRIELTHTCLTCRGARQTNARVVVTARAGALAGSGNPIRLEPEGPPLP
ncbi:MAG: GTP cyclohydrolase I [Polyangiaceae bacterium]|nr:GTP cyclohydrolase I [Polyangiaceae bacterium]